jgi:predicted permease
MKLIAVMLKDLKLISRHYPGLIELLVVPIVVITVIASATQSGNAALPP